MPQGPRSAPAESGLPPRGSPAQSVLVYEDTGLLDQGGLQAHEQRQAHACLAVPLPALQLAVAELGIQSACARLLDSLRPGSACRAQQDSPTGLLVYEDTTRLIDPRARDHVGWRACEVQAVRSIHQDEVPDEKEN